MKYILIADAILLFFVLMYVAYLGIRLHFYWRKEEKRFYDNANRWRNMEEEDKIQDI